MHDLSDLYSCLYPEACRIVRGTVRRLPQVDRQEVAHDITVDFLFSNSFRQTYNGSGKLSPFFNSYVRRKCRGVIERGNVDSMLLSLSSVHHDAMYEDSHLQVLETIEEVYRQMEFLSTRKFISFKFQISIDLKDLYVAVLQSAAKYGSMRYSYLKKALGCSNENVLKGAVVKMRRLLKKREVSWLTKFS